MEVRGLWMGYSKMIKAYAEFKWKAPFWEQPFGLWEEMNNVGVHSNYIASIYATKLMLK